MLGVVSVAALVAQASAAVPTTSLPKPLPSTPLVMSYPPDALRRSQQGRAEVTLTVSEKGKPTRCVITRSSGSNSLDHASCETFMRLRFDPARNADGDAVKGMYVTHVNWRIPAQQGNMVPSQAH